MELYDWRPTANSGCRRLKMWKKIFFAFPSLTTSAPLCRHPEIAQRPIGRDLPPSSPSRPTCTPIQEKQRSGRLRPRPPARPSDGVDPVSTAALLRSSTGKNAAGDITDWAPAGGFQPPPPNTPDPSTPCTRQQKAAGCRFCRRRRRNFQQEIMQFKLLLQRFKNLQAEICSTSFE